MLTLKDKVTGYFLGILVGFFLFVSNITLPSLEFLIIFLSSGVIGYLYQKGYQRVCKWSIIFVAFTLLFVLFTPITNIISDLISIRKPTDRADAIVILEGDPTFIRFIYGISLFHKRYAHNLVFTQNEKTGTNSYLYSKLYNDMNLETRNVFTLKSAYNTKTEAKELKSLAKRVGWKKVILVTSPIHSRRATYVFQKEAQKEGLSIYPMPAPDPNRKSTVFKPWGRLLMLRELTYEFFALIKYKVSGWI